MFNAQLTQARQNVLRYKEYEGVLGDGSGNPYAPGKSRYWVRFPSGVDPDGNSTYTAPRAIRYSGEGNFLAREGVEVLVHIDEHDEVETITRIAPDYPERAGFDGRILNASDTINKWVDVKNFIRLLCRPVGSGLSTSSKVTIRENPFHVDMFGDFSSYYGTLPDDQLSLSAYIPSADEHCLIVVFFDFLLNEPFVTASTAQALTDELDTTDYSECFAQQPHNECLPLLSLELADAQTSVSNDDVIEDLRTWLPTPLVYGFPNPIPSDKALLIRETHQMITYNLTIEGTLTIEGSMTVL